MNKEKPKLAHKLVWERASKHFLTHIKVFHIAQLISWLRPLPHTHGTPAQSVHAAKLTHST